jgi:hypothetical protein
VTPDDLAPWDPLWTDAPRRWGEAPWSGNGTLGALAYVHPAHPDRLRIETGHAAACMARPGLDPADSCRIPVGHLELVLPGPVTGGAARLHLAEGGWTVVCRHAGGTTTARGRVQADAPVVLIAWEGPGEPRFVPAVAVPDHDRSVRTPCPPPYRADAADAAVVVQPTDPAGAIATAWCSGPGRLALAIAVAADADRARADALAAARPDDAAARARHAAWWRGFWARWDLRLPDPVLQANALVQIARLGSAIRAGAPVCDLLGPWYRPTRWPFLFQNLNLQTTYPACAPLGLADEAAAFPAWLTAAAPALAANVPATLTTEGAWVGSTSARDGRSAWEGCLERGNLLWHLQVWWELAHHAGDGRDLDGAWLDLLERALEVHLALLVPGDDGRLHLPPTRSPEYGIAPDCTYDLALCAWGLGAALAHAPTHPQAPRWRDALARLAEPHVDPATGLMVGAGMPFAQSHRHHSHLFPYHPLRLRAPDALFRKSLEHWLSLDRHLEGYSYGLAASCWALLGEGDRAAAAIRAGMERHLQPNGMYLEGSHPYDRKAPPPGVTRMLSPTIETPFIALRATLDLLLRSDAAGIDLFPAVPAAWPSAGFAGLHAWGGVRIDAAWTAAGTAWVRLAGRGRVRLRTRWAAPPSGPAIAEGDALAVDLDAGPVELRAVAGGLPAAPAPAPWFGAVRIATLPAAIREDPCPDW